MLSQLDCSFHLQAQQQPALQQQLQQISSLSRLSSSLHVTASAALGGDAQVRADTRCTALIYSRTCICSCNWGDVNAALASALTQHLRLHKPQPLQADCMDGPPPGPGCQ